MCQERAKGRFGLAITDAGQGHQVGLSVKQTRHRACESNVTEFTALMDRAGVSRCSGCRCGEGERWKSCASPSRPGLSDRSRCRLPSSRWPSTPGHVGQGPTGIMSRSFLESAVGVAQMNA